MRHALEKWEDGIDKFIRVLCGPISAVVKLEMSSSPRFFVWKWNIWVLRTRKLPDAKMFIHSIFRN